MKKILSAVLVLTLALSLCAFAMAEGAMSYADYVAAELDSEVTIEAYVQAHQSWWDNKVTIYAADEDAVYDRIIGFKSEWSGEVEIVDVSSFEIVEGDPYIAEAVDVTDLLGTDALAEKINQLVAFKGMTVEDYGNGAAFAYKNEEEKTDDLYFKVSKDGQTYEFTVEFYLCGQDTDVYKAVEALNIGDVVDLEGFLYWYNGANPHITAVTPAE